MAEEYKKLVLKANEEKRILDGEFWVYDNEIAGSLKPFQGGELCRLYSSAGMYIATGYVNPASTITFRVLSLDAEATIDRAFLAGTDPPSRQPAPGFAPGKQLLPHGLRRGRFPARAGHRPLRRLFHRPDHHRRHGKLQGRHPGHCQRNVSPGGADRKIADLGQGKESNCPHSTACVTAGPAGGKGHRWSTV